MRKTPPAVNRKDTNLKRGPWTAEEDQLLIGYIRKHGPGKWRTVPKNAGLNRCGKSCRLRWINYLRPDIKRGKFSLEEEETIIQLHTSLGNKWSAIAAQLPGRTDNEIKNYWNTNIRKRLLRMGFDPTANASVRSDDYYVGELSVAPTPSHPLAGLCDSSIASSSTNLPSWPGLQDIMQYSMDNPSTDNPDRFHLPASADAVALSSQSPTPQYHQKSYGKQYQGDSTHNIIGSSFLCSNDQLQPFPDYDNYINQYAQIPAHGFPLIDDGGCQIQPVNLQELPNTGIESAGPPSLMDVVEDFGFGSINIITATTHAQSCCPDDQRNNFYFDNDIHMFAQS